MLDSATRQAIRTALIEWYDEKPERKKQQVVWLFGKQVRRVLQDEPPQFCEGCGKPLKPHKIKWYLGSVSNTIWQDTVGMKPDGNDGQPYVWATVVHRYCLDCNRKKDRESKGTHYTFSPTHPGKTKYRKG